MSDEKKGKPSPGDYLAETDKDLAGCSVMVSYSRKGEAGPGVVS